MASQKNPPGLFATLSGLLFKPRVLDQITVKVSWIPAIKIRLNVAELILRGVYSNVK